MLKIEQAASGNGSWHCKLASWPVLPNLEVDTINAGRWAALRSAFQTTVCWEVELIFIRGLATAVYFLLTFELSAWQSSSWRHPLVEPVYWQVRAILPHPLPYSLPIALNPYFLFHTALSLKLLKFPSHVLWTIKQIHKKQQMRQGLFHLKPPYCFLASFVFCNDQSQPWIIH